MSAALPAGAGGPPMAGGAPLDEAVADQAAQWLTVLMSGEATDADRERWRQWRAAHPDHERAWQHIENVTGRFRTLAPRAAYRALSLAGVEGQRRPARRRVLRTLLWASAAGAGGVLASRTRTWRQMAADLRTGTGERRTVMLEEGTEITLNTDTAVEVRFDAALRRLRLVAGEVLVTTGHAAGALAERPFEVESAEGRIRALGTRFTVRQHAGRTQIAVFEGAVQIAPAAGAARRRVHAGEQAFFTRTEIGGVREAGEAETAWTRGQLLADEMRLGDFLAEVGRYRPGVLRCDPQVADLRLSGVFPLGETDRILEALPSVLPVRVSARTRYWVTVHAQVP